MPQKPRHLKYWRLRNKKVRRAIKNINLSAWRIPVLMGHFEFLDTAIEMAKQEQERAANLAELKRMMAPMPIFHSMDTIELLYARFGLGTWGNQIIVPDMILPKMDPEPLTIADFIPELKPL